MKQYEHNESGLVSIFSVIFFMIFMSVIVVGFIRIMGDEVRQTTDNDLTASALVSAQSGAEEGKRILLYCMSAGLSAPERARCDRALNSSECDTAIEEFRSVPGVGLNVDNPEPGVYEGIVSTQSDYQQRYTCLSIIPDTETVEEINIPDGSSRLIPLTATGAFNQVTFSWHNKDPSRDGVATLGVPRYNSSKQEWNVANLPAMMRLQFIPYPKTGAINLDTLETASRTVFVGPSGNSTVTSESLASNDPRRPDPNNRAASNTLISGCDSNEQYLCSITLTFDGSLPDTSSNNYMLRVTSYYRGAHVRLSLANSGTTVNFDNVQPLIDVTGRTNDVFRRIQTRVAFEGDYFMSQYGLSSGSDICKQMTITNDLATSRNNCPN